MTTSRLVLGAMMFGTTIDETTSFALLDRFVEAGGEWIDTADCYAFWASDSGFGGDSEELLGRWLAARPGVRDRVKIATKFGAEPRVAGDWPASRTGLGRTAIRSQFEGSLRRLGTDYIDLAWAHMEDRSVPIEETPRAGHGASARRIIRRGSSSVPVPTPGLVAASRSPPCSTTARICGRAPASVRPGRCTRSGCSTTN
jgi:aryl-alcohol dehydrogenase-like predicted oxidoreductase